MGIFSRPSISGFRKRDNDGIQEGLWVKCPGCSGVVHQLELQRNLLVCPKCNHHFMMPGPERIAMVVDEGSFEEVETEISSANPLGFNSYREKIAALQEKTKLKEGVVTGRSSIHGQKTVICVMDFRFFAGSMGSVVGEKITRAIELAIQEKRGVVIFSASSGARMQEGMLSLMQMAKTCGALAKLDQASLPYISVMTHPTTGGVTASFATVGDINLAEPGSMIGFAGPRVVKETTHQNLPPGFQTAEFMLEHGLVDSIVERGNLRARLGQILGLLMPK